MASPVDTTVKFFSSAMVGSPVLNGTAGSQIAMLDAILVNGFGLKSADSLVVAGGIATINVSTGHSAIVDSVILVAGATPSDLNGEQRVVSVTTNSVSFATAVSNQTATGSITFKIAAAGWSKPFTGTNLAVFKQIDPASSGMCLRIDDTVAKTSRMVGYESMTDVNTGSLPFPTAAQFSGGIWSAKSASADSVARAWFAVADAKTFYLFKNTSTTYAAHYETFSFGDASSFRVGDAYGCFIQGSITDYSTSYQSSDHLARFATSTSSGMYVARPYNGLGSPIQPIRSCPTINTSNDYYSGDTGSTAAQYPNLADGGLYVSAIYLSENSGAVFRGTIRGIFGVPQRVTAGNFAAGDVVTGVAGLPGRRLRAMTTTPATSSSTGGVYFLDVTGPWA